MNWPPIKSWTRVNAKNGHFHFVAINYGGIQNERWVNMVSVLNGEVRLKVFFSELKDQKKWLRGWDNDHHLNTSEFIDSDLEEDLNVFTCLHPSMDSGFLMPLNDLKKRSWN